MGTLMYAVVRSDLSKVLTENNKGFPENSGETVKFYTNAKECNNAANAAWTSPPANLQFNNLSQNFKPLQEPNIVMQYTVELSQEQINKLNNVTPSFGSAGQYEGKIDKSTIKDVEFIVSRDFLHHKSFSSIEHVPVGQEPTHSNLISEITNRQLAYDKFELSLNQTHEIKRDGINLHDPEEACKAAEAFGAHGFMNQDPASLSTEQMYCQQFMRMMTQDQPLDVALKAEPFHLKYNANLDALEQKFPNASINQLQVEAMRNTINAFNQSAVKSHNSQEQQMFEEMEKMNNACGKVMNTVSQRNMTDFVKEYVDCIQKAFPNSSDFENDAKYIADKVEKDAVFGEIDDLDYNQDDVGDLD